MAKHARVEPDNKFKLKLPFGSNKSNRTPSHGVSVFDTSPKDAQNDESSVEEYEYGYSEGFHNIYETASQDGYAGSFAGEQEAFSAAYPGDYVGNQASEYADAYSNDYPGTYTDVQTASYGDQYASQPGLEYPGEYPGEYSNGETGEYLAQEVYAQGLVQGYAQVPDSEAYYSEAYTGEPQELSEIPAQGLDEAHTGTDQPSEPVDEFAQFYSNNNIVIASNDLAKSPKEENVFEKKARKRRVRLRIIAIALVAIVIVLGGVGGYLFIQSQNDASSSAKSQKQETDELTATNDGNTVSTQKVEVPDITVFIDTNLNKVLAEIGHGAQLANEYEINGKGEKYHTEQTIDLTEDPADSRVGVPQVFLSYNWHGNLIRTGYCATTSQLGYGVSSFEDMVNNQHVLEKTLNGAGFQVEEGSIQLPSDKTAYQSYSDSGTLVREMYDCSGKAKTSGGKNYIWEAVILYDYTTANATGNLADTLRQVYVYCLQY